MTLPILQVDAFTDAAFTGNPAAVCLLEGDRPEAWMRAVAAEMNLSETAFLVSRGERRFHLRWFTPTTEVPLCGHATLASAHVLWETGRIAEGQEITFDTLSGPLMAHGRAGSITIDLPAIAVESAPLPDAVGRALAVNPAWTGQTRERGSGKFEYLVECASEREVVAARPDFGSLRQVAGGVILTARAETSGADIASRYFAAYYGIDEDPVTGSAHCALATYWAPKLGRNEFTARQVSARGGLLGVRLDGSRVYLTGRAVTVLRGELVD